MQQNLVGQSVIAQILIGQRARRMNWSLENRNRKAASGGSLHNPKERELESIYSVRAYNFKGPL